MDRSEATVFSMGFLCLAGCFCFFISTVRGCDVEQSAHRAAEAQAEFEKAKVYAEMGERVLVIQE